LKLDIFLKEIRGLVGDLSPENFYPKIDVKPATGRYWEENPGAVSAEALLKIFELWPWAKKMLLEDKKPDRKSVDPKREELRRRIDRLLKSDFMFDHLYTQIGICEAFERQTAVEDEEARILQTLRDAGVDEEKIQNIKRSIVKKYVAPSEIYGSVHEPQTDSGPVVPEKTASNPGGAPLSHHKKRTPPRKK